MKAGIRQVGKQIQSQEQHLSSRLYQFMEVLGLSHADLLAHIESQAEDNPVLIVGNITKASELDGADGANKDIDRQPSGGTIEDGDSYFDRGGSGGYIAGGYSSNFLDIDNLEGFITSREDLHGLLKSSHVDSKIESLAAFIIDNLSESGYMDTDPKLVLDGFNRVCETFVADIKDYGHALMVVQNLGIPGLGARSVQECLELQLKEVKGTEVARKMVKDYFDDIVGHRYELIARRMKLSIGEVDKALKLIKSLRPRPGSLGPKDDSGWVRPDIVYTKREGKWTAVLASNGGDRVRLNRRYLRISQNKDNLDEAARTYLGERIESARRLIEAIEQRQKTIKGVADEIGIRQVEFLERGIARLTPMTMEEIGRAIGVNKSTVSRAVSGKYIQTPKGTWPLKKLFSGAISSDVEDGEGETAEGVKAAIKAIISAEDPKKPLSDQAILEQLERSGFNIARRTVAKYREAMGILPARQRRG